MPKFDDRAVCFHTGKKISPPMNERKICACCGQRIVKGEILEIGHVGDDCADIIRRRLSDKVCFQSTVEEFIVKVDKKGEIKEVKEWYNGYTFGKNFTHVDTTRKGEMLYRSTYFDGSSDSKKASKTAFSFVVLEILTSVAVSTITLPHIQAV